MTSGRYRCVHCSDRPLRPDTGRLAHRRRRPFRAAWSSSCAARAVDLHPLIATCGRPAGQPERPGLQKVLDSLVTGRYRVAPGDAAFVSGPHGAWAGAAGFANVSGHDPMTPDVPQPDRKCEQALDGDRRRQARGGGQAPPRRHRREMAARRLPYGRSHRDPRAPRPHSGMVDEATTSRRSRATAAHHDPALRRQLVLIKRASAKNPAITIDAESARCASRRHCAPPPGTDAPLLEHRLKTVAATSPRSGIPPGGPLIAARHGLDEAPDTTNRADRGHAPSATSTSQRRSPTERRREVAGGSPDPAGSSSTPSDEGHLSRRPRTGTHRLEAVPGQIETPVLNSY